DVRSASELHTENHVHGIIAALFGEVHDFGIESDNARVQCWKRREDGAGHRAINNRLSHRTALIHADNYGPIAGALSPRVEIDFFRYNRPKRGLIVLEVPTDGRFPIDVRD